MDGYRFVVFLHILGWAQWMVGQLALAGLLRREALFGAGVRGEVGGALKGFWITALVGAGLALLAGLWLIFGYRPELARMGWVHTKLLLGVIALVVLLWPLRGGLKRLSEGGAPAKGAWFPVSLAIFVVMIFLGTMQPF